MRFVHVCVEPEVEVEGMGSMAHVHHLEDNQLHRAPGLSLYVCVCMYVYYV